MISPLFHWDKHNLLVKHFSFILFWQNNKTKRFGLSKKIHYKFVVKAIAMRILMEQYYFTLRILINMHPISPLSPIKI